MPPVKKSCGPSARSAPACSSSRSPTRQRLAGCGASDPPSTPASTSSLAATGLRTQTGALVLAVGRGADEIATPGPQFRLAADDVLVVVGQPPQVRAAARLVAGETAA